MKFEERAGSPEELVSGEKVLAEATPEMRPLLEALMTLTAEQKSWLAMADQLAFQKRGMLGMPALQMLLVSAAVLIPAGVLAWFLPGVWGAALSIGACLAIVLVWKSAGSIMHWEYTPSGVDLEIARLIDEPQRYLDTLRQLQTASEHIVGVGKTYHSRCEALERALSQRGRASRSP